MKRAFIATTAVALFAGYMLYDKDDTIPTVPVSDDLRAIVDSVPAVPPPSRVVIGPAPGTETQPQTGQQPTLQADFLDNIPSPVTENQPVETQPEVTRPDSAQPEEAQPEEARPEQSADPVVTPLRPERRTVENPLPTTTPPLTNVFAGMCTYEGSRATIPVEVLHTKDAQGNDQSQLWFGERGWTHIFRPQIPRGVGPEADNIYRVPLHRQGISLAYDMNNRVGRATMSRELFNQYFNGFSEGRLYNDKWICRLGQTDRARFVPQSLINGPG